MFGIFQVRTQLRPSKSHPNDFLLQQTQNLAEDGDNSSSGVSSDQDVPVGPPTGFDDSLNRSQVNNERNQHNGSSVAVNNEKEINSAKRSSYSGGMLTRHAVRRLSTILLRFLLFFDPKSLTNFL